MKKKLLFISSIFPSTAANKHATYSLQMLSALAEHCNIDIINPIPWTLKKDRIVPYTEHLHEMTVYHPTYWYTPGFLRQYYGRFYFASIKTCADKIIQHKGCDVILSSWLYPDGWAATEIAKNCHIPSYLFALGTDINRLKKTSKVAEQTIEAISDAEKTFCMSYAMREKLINTGAPPDKLLVMYNGVNRDIFNNKDKSAARRELSLPVEGHLILFVGNLLKTKGLDELADAFSIINRRDHSKATRLVVAGSGQYERNLKKRLLSYGLIDQTFFMGSCSLEVVSTLMNAADVVCLPSYSEGLPNVVLEAICCNAKIVATQVGGIPELQVNHRNLYLCRPRDPKELAERLEFALNAECYEDKADDVLSWGKTAGEIATLVLK